MNTQSLNHLVFSHKVQNVQQKEKCLGVRDLYLHVLGGSIQDKFFIVQHKIRLCSCILLYNVA